MDEDLIRIGDHVAVFKRRWRTVVATLVLGLGLGLAVSFTQPDLYRGEVRLLLEPGTTAAAGGQVMSPEEVATQAAVVDSIPVARRVVERYELDEEPADLLAELEVEVVDNQRVLAVTMSDPDPDRAADFANAFAEEYVELREERSSALQETARATYAEELESIQARLAEIRLELTNAQSDEASTQLRLEEQTLIQRADAVSLALLNLDAESAGEQAGGQVLIEATAAALPYQPRPLRSSALGGVIGLMLGAALAYGRDRQDDAIRDEGRMRRALGGRPVLGLIPESAEEGRGRVGTLLAPWSPLSEAYRTLNSNIKFLAAGDGESRRLAKVVLVSSAQPGEGKTSVSSNLAVTAARAGLSVVLVDADLRSPTLASRFGLDLPVGFSDLLIDDLPLEPHLHPVGDTGLRILSSGTVPPNPSELLASPRAGKVIQELARDCDLVIVDSAPIMRVADSLELVREVDLILLVAKQRTSRLRDYTAAVERVSQVGGQVAGGVLNNVAGKTLSYGYGAASEATARSRTHGTSRGSRVRRLGRNPT